MWAVRQFLNDQLALPHARHSFAFGFNGSPHLRQYRAADFSRDARPGAGLEE
jgi:hypothetical protein